MTTQVGLILILILCRLKKSIKTSPNFNIMKKFFINNGNWMTMALACIFFMTELIGDYLPDFSNKYLTLIIYFIIAMVPVSLSIYYNNKK
jgi:hypothetical protein